MYDTTNHMQAPPLDANSDWQTSVVKRQHRTSHKDTNANLGGDDTTASDHSDSVVHESQTQEAVFLYDAATDVHDMLDKFSANPELWARSNP